MGQHVRVTEDEGSRRECNRRTMTLSDKVRNIFEEYRMFTEYPPDLGTYAKSTKRAASLTVQDRLDCDAFNVLPKSETVATDVAIRPTLRNLLRVRPHPLDNFKSSLSPEEQSGEIESIKPSAEFSLLDELRFFGYPPPQGARESPSAATGEAKEIGAIEVKHFTQIVESDRENPFFLCANANLPLPGSRLTLVIDGGKVACKCYSHGNVLRATLPPLTAGSHRLSFRCSFSNRRILLLMPAAYLSGPVQTANARDTKSEMFQTETLRHLKEKVSALPLLVVRAPCARRDPLLCYSTAKALRERRSNSTAAPSGPFTAADLENFVSFLAGDVLSNSRSSPETPFLDNKGHLLSNQRPDDAFNARLQEYLDGALNINLDPDFGAAETVLLDTAASCDRRIPLPFLASLYKSCAESTRLAISCFHAKVFEFEPFNVLSAHLLVKSHYSEDLTIFGFTLTPSPAGPHPDRKDKLPYSAAIDRFEATERLCADTRFWRYVDGTIPLKNKEASLYQIRDWNHPNCPVPRMLRHARNPYKNYPEGMQVAPGVFLFFERWPTEVLPMPLLPVDQSNSAAMEAVRAAVQKHHLADVAAASIAQNRTPGGKASAAVKSSVKTPHFLSPDKGAEAAPAVSTATVADKSIPRARGDASSKRSMSAAADGLKASKHSGSFNTAVAGAETEMENYQQQYFAVTLCVGKHIFSSVVGVSASLVDFIVNKWLCFVPEKRQQLQQPQL